MNESFTSQEARSFLDWMMSRVVSEASGEGMGTSEKMPKGRFWLGRLAPEQVVQASILGARAERLEPCATGIVILWHPSIGDAIACTVSALAWSQSARGSVWEKTDAVDEKISLPVPAKVGESTTSGEDQLRRAFANVGTPGLSAEVRAELADGKQGPELTLTVVNTTTDVDRFDDANIYEVALAVEIATTVPFVLDELPESFAYDRTVDAYGVNCGVERVDSVILRTADYVKVNRHRPDFWDADACGTQPDFTFTTLADNPIPSLFLLVKTMRKWGEEAWSEETLARRAESEGWSSEMAQRASDAADAFRSEVSRAQGGVELLRSEPDLLKAFKLMNSTFARTVGISHKSWRPFQIGFLLTALQTLLEPAVDEVGVLRFATGGGKTETYLGLLVTAAFLDRMSGKLWGITGWARFPLRMLSLQQTQRFADVFAAAELVRRDEDLHGDSFSVGFFVGRDGTPNILDPEPRFGPDYRDETMPAKYQVLLNCPFCGSDQLEMKFSQDTWTLDHFCRNDACTWSGSLPFRIVDQEIFRFLPTVVVGTLDKAALVAFQAAMRGLYAAPYGHCPEAGHGFTYAKRYGKPHGCLYPGCTSSPLPLPQEARRFPPTIRIQDELHLLRDSLGAVDAHYEALLDHLQADYIPPRILASSATIAGYQEQVRALYRREARLFPAMGPKASRSFWMVDSANVGRTFVGLAPRAVTLDYASDRINESLQRSVRWALKYPEETAQEAGVLASAIPGLVSFYGVDVVYGSTLKDVEAASRSFETQMDLQPVNSVSLTGRTPLDEVRAAMARLDEPEELFEDRIHLVAASSMLSHGVDIDRLNLMVMLGLPLSTAEFIQTTSRVGRSHPGLVFVLHKIGRERDAKVYRSFTQFVEQGDRLVDPVPITTRSRRVLELTFAAVFLGRLYGIHEPAAIARGLKPLTKAPNIRRAFETLPVIEADELQACIDALGVTGQLDEGLRADLKEYMRAVFMEIYSPTSTDKKPADLLPRSPMTSLRDVEDQVPVFSRGGDR